MTTENNTGTTETFIITEFKSGGIDTVKSFLENNFDTYSAEINAEVPQIDSEEGRKRIKALGTEINKKLAEVDSPMRDYLRDIKKQPKLIEAIAKENKEKFTKLRADILKPLEEAQEWQDKDLATLNEVPTICGQHDITSDRLNEIIEWVESFDLDSVWPELKKKFKVAHENALTTARVTLERVEAQEAQAAELKRFQDEAKAREDEKKAEKAAEEARKQERAKAAAKLTNAVNARIKNELTIYPYQTKSMSSTWYQEQITRLQSIVIGDEWEPLQVEAKEALSLSRNNALQGFTDAKMAEEQAEEARKARDGMNELHSEALSMDAAFNAAAAERKAIADEKDRQKREAQQRENDKKHRTTVNRRNLAVLLAMGISEDDGKKVITAIAKGELPDIRIYY
ncbi:coil containing protein [Vibrio phage 1.086.O._10N.222.51.F8]|nr:coil containing protein [Vibrio phage 1.086.O._10N.222.51.F8]